MRLTQDTRRANSPEGAEGGRASSRSRVAWKSRSPGPISTIRLAALRLRRGRVFLLLLALGMVIACVFAATVPLYNALVANVQLQHALSGTDPQARNIEAEATISAGVSLNGIQTQIEEFGQTDLSSFVTAKPFTYITSDSVLVGRAGKQSFDLTVGAVQATLDTFDYERAAPYMKIVAGRIPAATANHTPGEALITQQLATKYSLKVGDTLQFVEFGNHDNTLTATVVGIWEPIDESDPFWNGFSYTANQETPPAIYPILLTRDAVTNGFDNGQQTFTTQLRNTVHVVYYVDDKKITVETMGKDATAIQDFRKRISQDIRVNTPTVLASGVATELDSSLGSAANQTNLLQLPLFMVATPTIGLALFFVAIMASMLIEVQAQDLATLKSRGLGGLQLLGTFAIQGIPVAVLGAVVGPLLAAFLALTLVRVFLPAQTLSQSGVTLGYLAQVAPAQSVAVAAIAAALLGLAALAYSAASAAQLDVLAFRREMSRSSRQPFWRRYQLDLLLILLCVLAYLDLGQFGGLSTRLALGNGANSPFLLLTPSLLLLGGALLMLRVIPLVARLGLTLATRSRGLAAQAAFAAVARNSGRYSRVVLLLALAVGLGLFAVSFDAALTQNAHDRAAYEVGGDLRLPLLFKQTGSDDQRDRSELEQLPDVQAVTPTFRGQASAPSPTGDGDQVLNILGIDPTSFANVASTSWRSDYASKPLATLLNGLTPQRSVAADPMSAIVSDNFAELQHLKVGDDFVLHLEGIEFITTTFHVTGIVHDFPTMYPDQAPLGFVVVNLSDMQTAYKHAESGAINEYWLRTSGGTTTPPALLAALDKQANTLGVTHMQDRRQEQVDIAASPLNAGMRGLLLAGTALAALLAFLGVVVQAALAAHQRIGQFAILRTLGTSRRQVATILLYEQSIVFGLGLVGGTILGLILVTATLPYLQFSDTAIDPATIGVPPYQLAANPLGTVIFYAVMLAAFALALWLGARRASQLGLGRTLRIGED